MDLQIGKKSYNLQAFKGMSKTRFLKEKLGSESDYKRIQDNVRGMANRSK